MNDPSHRTHSCFSHEFLRAFAADRLDEEIRGQIERHLEQCVSCAETVRQMGPRETQSDVGETRIVPRSAASAEERDAEGRGGDESNENDLPPRIESVDGPALSEMLIRAAGTPTGDRAHDSDVRHAPESMGQVGPYRVLRKIGRGGMGSVFYAVHVKLDREVALKTLPARQSLNEDAVRRFEQEMKAIGRLDHPNIVRATDAGEWNGVHYLAMEYVDGTDLAHLMKRLGPLSVPEACEIIRRAAEALQHAHEQGLVHRDIKPSNIMVTRAGQVKVLDFGLALLATAGSGQLTADRIMGTVDYMAPEQATNSHEVDHRADIYSLGCTLYELLCGTAPFGDASHDSFPKKMVAHATEKPPAIGTFRHDVPRAVVRLVERMLAKDSRNRPKSAAEVTAALEVFTEHADLSRLAGTCADAQRTEDDEQRLPNTRTAPTAARRRLLREVSARPRWRAATAVALLFMLVGGLFLTPAVYRIVTNRGELVIEVEEDVADEVKVIVQGENVQIDSRNGWSIGLRAGAYRLALAEGSDELTLSKERVEVKRNGRTIVRVTRRNDRAGTRRSDPATSHDTTPSGPVAAAPSGNVRKQFAPPARLPDELSLGSWKPGPRYDDLSGLAWQPRTIPGVRRWQVVSRFPRGYGIGLRRHPKGKFWSYSEPKASARIYVERDGRLVYDHSVPMPRFHYRTTWHPERPWVALSRIYAEASNQFMVWDAAKRRPVKIEMPSFFAYFGGWSPDGKQMLVASPSGVKVLSEIGADPQVYEWSVQVPRRPNEIAASTWSPDGKWIAAIQGKFVQLWKVDGTKTRLLKSGPEKASALAWTADSKYLAAGYPGEIRIAAVEEEDSEQDIVLKTPASPVRYLAFSPGGSVLAMTSRSFKLVAWKWKRRSVLIRTSPDGRENKIEQFAFSPDGSWLAASDWKSNIRLFRIPGGQLASVLSDPLRPDDIGMSIVWHSHGKSFTTAQWDGNLKMWRVGQQQPIQSLPPRPVHPSCVTWSPGGRQFAVGTASGDIVVWDAATGRTVRTIGRHEAGSVRAVDWHPRRAWIAAVGGDDVVRVWDAEKRSGPPVYTAAEEKSEVFDVRWSPDGQMLAACGGQALRILGADDGRPLGKYILSSPSRMVAWSPGSEFLALLSRSGGGEVQIRSARNGGVVRTIREIGGFGRGIAWSRDAREIATASADGVRVWDAESGRLKHRLDAAFHRAAWSPDGQRLVAFDKWSVRTFDATTRSALGSWENNYREVVSIAVDPSGRFVVTSSRDQTLQLWNLAEARLVWTALLFGPGRTVVFNPAGEVVWADSGAEEQLAYLVERSDQPGRIETHTATEFRQIVEQADGGRD